MSEIRKVWKLLLQKPFYEKHKDTLPVSSFDEIGRDLLGTLEIAHQSIKENVKESDISSLHFALNPTLTTANKNTIEAYLENIKDEANIDPAIADTVYSSLWRREIGRYISEYGIRLADGDYTDISDLVDYVSRVGTSLTPQDFDEPVNTDPIALFTRLNARGKWKLNIPTLDRKIGYISPGQFIMLLARPESGKTATIVNLMAGREGFAAQGAKTHLICNEEGADRTAGRAVCCYNQVSINTAMQDPSSVKTEGWDNVRKNMVFLHKPEITAAQLESYVKDNRPDVLIIDQLDHISVVGNYEKGHERLGAVYRKARELTSKYDCVIIAVSQASADAEGRSIVTYAMAEGSKTSKAATADLIVGIGRTDEATGEEGNCVLRHYTVSKNKLSGWRGTAVVKLLQDESRLVP